MPNVTINGPGVITGQFNYTESDGSTTTFYGWTFSVTVNGQAGVYTVWIDSDTDEAAAAAAAIEDLTQSPGALGPISDGTNPDQQDDQDDDDDGQLADGGEGDDSVSA